MAIPEVPTVSANVDTERVRAQGAEHAPASAEGRLAESSSVQLLLRARGGDAAALDALFARHLPSLHRWARGRLPRWARDVADTADMVQDVLMHTFHRLGTFEPRRHRALQAYLRQAVTNRIRDEIRRVGRRPPPDELDSDQLDPGPSPLHMALDAESTGRYKQALARLREEERQLVVARLELGYTYEQLAVLGGRTPDAARMAVRRAVVRLAEEMSSV